MCTAQPFCFMVTPMSGDLLFIAQKIGDKPIKAPFSWAVTFFLGPKILSHRLCIGEIVLKK